MTNTQPQPEQTVAEILAGLANYIVESIHLEPTSVEYTKLNQRQATAALNRQALATALRLIGEDDAPFNMPIGEPVSTYTNNYRQQLRQAFTDYYGGGE